MRNRSYSELSQRLTLEDRFAYLKIGGSVGVETFGYDRWLNQGFYTSREWKQIRDIVIVRDDGNDLGDPNHPIPGRIIIHHMNPIEMKDLVHGNLDILNPEYLISCSHRTHNAIHYGDETLLPQKPIERYPGDTSPWLMKGR